MEELAINGGLPVRSNKIFYGRQCIYPEDIEAVVKVLKSERLTQGPEIQHLEMALCEYTGAKHAVLASSGTAALHLACIVAGIQEGDEVITSPFTFAASANCIRYCGGIVRFADIDSQTYNINPESVKKLINNRTKAIVAVDYAGQPADYDKLRNICDEYNLVLIEDAAHAIGSCYKTKRIGSIADLTTFSFHPVKTVTGGEGGAVLTNFSHLARKLQLAANHGISKNQEDFLGVIDGNWHYEQIMLGYNYRITDIQAALIQSQLNKIQYFKERRREIYNTYNQNFTGLNGIKIPYEEEYNDSCWHLYTVRIDDVYLKCSRKEFFEALSAENIQPQIHYIPIYWHPYYESLGYPKGLCRNAEKIYEEILSLPLYPGMSDLDVEDVIAGVKKVHKYFVKRY